MLYDLEQFEVSILHLHQKISDRSDTMCRCTCAVFTRKISAAKKNVKRALTSKPRPLYTSQLHKIHLHGYPTITNYNVIRPPHRPSLPSHTPKTPRRQTTPPLLPPSPEASENTKKIEACERKCRHSHRRRYRPLRPDRVYGRENFSACTE